MSYDLDDQKLAGVHQTWEMADFIQVRDAADGRQRWFPGAATLTQKVGGMYTFKINRVTINERLPREKFSFTPPDGTFVTDTTAPGGPKSRLVGGAHEEQELAAIAAERAAKELQALRTSETIGLDARPRHRSLAPWVAAGALLLLAAIAVFWHCSRSRP